MSGSGEKFRWIRNDIDISSFYDRLPSDIKFEISEAEKADRNGEWWVLDAVSDNIECFSKVLIPDVISRKEWELLCTKYYPLGGPDNEQQD